VTNCATSFFSNFCSERRFGVSIELPISLSQLRIASKLVFASSCFQSLETFFVS
jgi:hypothetical protein